MLLKVCVLVCLLGFIDKVQGLLIQLLFLYAVIPLHTSCIHKPLVKIVHSRAEMISFDHRLIIEVRLHNGEMGFPLETAETLLFHYNCSTLLGCIHMVEYNDCNLHQLYYCNEICYQLFYLGKNSQNVPLAASHM